MTDPKPVYSSLGNPIGSDYNPRGEDLTPQEAVDRIHALSMRAQRECYLPDDPETNNVNAGRVRALSQALTLLRRAGFEPDDGSVRLTDEEEMVEW